jgi:beta-lactamase regulating signal transducer with metallopeptidase domain
MATFLILFFVRGAIVFALALLAARLLHRASASLRFAVLIAALAAVLVLPVLDAIVPTWHTGALAPESGAIVAEPALPVPEPSVPAAIVRPAILTRTAAPVAIPWSLVLAALWAAGVLLALARVVIGSVGARRIARRAVPAASAHAWIAEAWRALGGRGRPPRVVVSDELEAPVAIGALAPVVVVPRSSAAWSAERWRFVLLHELAHVRRRDGLANLVAQVACSAHWIDPLAWIVARQLREQRELAADDAVLREGARASTYAEHLVAIATGTPHGAPLGALAMAEPSRFEARMVALLDGDRSRTPAGGRRAIAIGIVSLSVATIAACVSPEGPAHPAGTTPSTGSAAIVPSDPQLQAVADEQLDRAMAEHHATGAVAIVLDAKTGAVVAMSSRGTVDARAPRTPGSTFKPFTVAAAFDAGIADPTTKIDCENGVRAYGDKQLLDASPHGLLDIGTILAVSSNVGTAKLAEPLGDGLADAYRRFRFAPPAHLDTRSLDGAATAAGEGFGVSPLDLAAAYTAFADHGTVHGPGGVSQTAISDRTAGEVMTMLEGVVSDPEGTGHAAHIDGVRVAGKTGTAATASEGRHYASFVGIVPADAPRFVILVGFDGVAEAGGQIAAPVFATIATRALAR